MAENQDSIQPVTIESEMRQSYLDYEMSVIVGRALPDVRDGLKPVHRRIIWDMEQQGFRPDRPFVKCARTMRERRDLILNAIEHGISNGRVEGLNTKVRLIVRRAYGFHSADAALALVMLAAGPTTLLLPHEHQPARAAA